MLEAFQNYTISLSGGIAFYALTCMALVTLYAVYSITFDLFKYISKKRKKINEATNKEEAL